MEGWRYLQDTGKIHSAAFQEEILERLDRQRHYQTRLF